MTPEPIDPEALVAAIRGPSPRYKREAVDAIAAHPKQTTPYLLAILRDPRGPKRLPRADGR